MRRTGNAAQARNARLVVLLGLLALAAGAYFGLATLRFVVRSVPTTGTIVKRGGSTYTVRFQVQGRTVDFESDVPTTKGFFRGQTEVGTEVSVRYDPEAPGDARVADSRLLTFPFAMMLIGVLCLVGGRMRLRR